MLKVIKFIKKSYPEKELDIRFDIISKNNFVQANELLLDIFENILVNVVKYNENPTVEILIKLSKAKRDGSHFIKMEFIDNGIGIADPLKKLIFQKRFPNEK